MTPRKKGEEVKSLYNITPEQFDLYGATNTRN